MRALNLEELIKNVLPESSLTREEKAILLLADVLTKLRMEYEECDNRRKESIASYEKLRVKYQKLEKELSDLKRKAPITIFS